MNLKCMYVNKSIMLRQTNSLNNGKMDDIDEPHKKKILFLANHYVTLYSYRKELIQQLLQDGHDVYLSLPESSNNEYFKNIGCKIVSTKIDRRSINPLKDLKLIIFYKEIITKIQPDIIFSYTIKPNIYGSIVSNGKYKQICNITGTGATFLKKNIVSILCKWLYKISVKRCYKVFFQNEGDMSFFVKNRMVANNYELIPGSGCNLEDYQYVEINQNDVIRFIFIGRIMKLKGIDEYCEAAVKIKRKYKNVEFIIAGWIEEEAYKKIITIYQDEGIVNYIGFCNNIAAWIEKCHCTVLPSHGGEGIPNVLLESSAIGRACIGSKINGIVDVIDDGVTGFLFAPGNADDLAEKMEMFLKLDIEARKKMGLAGRQKIINNFDRKNVIESYLKEI